MYWWGDRGIWDYGEQNTNVVNPTKEMVKNGRLKELPPHFDVRGFDMPRPDIRGYKNSVGRLVRVGNDSQQNIGVFGAFAIPKINAAFNTNELSRLNLYFEYPSNRVTGGVLGQTDSITAPDGRDYSQIEINRHAMKDEPTIVHEVIHALRYLDDYENEDQDIDEAQTELETVARVSRDGLMKMRNCLGYYSYMTNGWEKLKQDRILLTGSLDRNLDGETARRRVKELFHKSNIFRLRVGVMTNRKGKRNRKLVRVDPNKMRRVPEWLDRFFYVISPDKLKIKMHIQSKKYVPLREVIKDIKTEYGKTSKIWEYRDGKKVKVS
jgi:hypothetical protein